MSIEHREYPRIALHADTSGAGGEWIATEKIHGASFVVATDGTTVRFGKRRAWLDPAEPFFGWQLLRARLEHAARAFFAHLGADGVVRVYGELFGGGYPHPDVPAVPGLTPVQTGIWYTPRLELAVFDAAFEDGVFLAHDELARACGAAELMMVPLIGRGPRADVFRISARRESLIPAALGLPAIPLNIAEGVVLKPAAALAAARRPVVKRKIEELAESSFGEARPFDPDAHLSLDELLELCSAFVNAPRIASARSKVGTETERVRQEVVLDVLVDLEAMLPRRFRALAGDELELLQRRIDALASAQLERSR